MKYRLTFSGRTIGVIEMVAKCSVVVEADSKLQAKLKAYDTHEHIAGGVDGVVAVEIPS